MGVTPLDTVVSNDLTVERCSRLKVSPCTCGLWQKNELVMSCDLFASCFTHMMSECRMEEEEEVCAWGCMYIHVRTFVHMYMYMYMLYRHPVCILIFIFYCYSIFIRTYNVRLCVHAVL